MIVGGPACVNTEAVTDPALPRPMSEDYQAPSGAGHPTPPPELVQQLRSEAPHNIRDTSTTRELHLITAAARWGADQELEACGEWLKAKEWIHPEFSDELRAARRPKPPSLSEPALEALDRMDQFPTAEDQYIIRRALERLQELEGNG
jgi:hypothetical protein